MTREEMIERLTACDCEANCKCCDDCTKPGNQLLELEEDDPLGLRNFGKW